MSVAFWIGGFMGVSGYLVKSNLALRVSALVLFSGLFSVSCAPKDKRLTDRTVPAPFAIAGKDLELSRHLLLQLGQTRRMMDVALASELNLRINGKIGAESDEGQGCQKLRKVSPDPERKTQSSSETFQIINRCLGESSEITADASLSGAETYQVSYQKNFPKGSDADQTLGMPAAITVTSSDLKFVLKTRTSPKLFDQITVLRRIEFRAELVAENETHADYRAIYLGEDQLKYDVLLEARDGVVTTGLRAIEFRVDKNARKVTSFRVEPDSMDLKAQIQTYTKSELALKRAVLTPGPSAVLTIVVNGELTSAEKACEVLSGQFKVKKQVDRVSSEIVVQAGQGEIRTEGATRKVALRICTDNRTDNIGQPVFLDAIESVYY